MKNRVFLLFCVTSVAVTLSPSAIAEPSGTEKQTAMQLEATQLLSASPEFQNFKFLEPGVKRFALHVDALQDFSESMQVDVLDRSVLPGTGVDVRNFPASKSFAFVAAAYPPPQPIKGSLQVEYYHAATDVVKSVGGGSNLEASLITSYFSLGGGFKSAAMRQNEQHSISGYLVLKFDPQYAFAKLANESLNVDAKRLFAKEGLKGFYATYGTHFVAEAKPAALYSVIYTFHADSAASLETFEKDIDVNLGVMNLFGVGFGNTVKEKLSSQSRQISFDFQEYYATSAGVMPLPPSASVGTQDPFFLLDPAAITARYNQFIASLPGANFPYTQVKLRPFAELLAPSMEAAIPQKPIVFAAAVASDINDMISDYTLMMQNTELWSYGLDANKAAELTNAGQAIDFAILDVLSDPKKSSIQKLNDATAKAFALGQVFFSDKRLWPAPVSAKLDAPIVAGTQGASIITVDFKCDKRLGKPSVRAVGNKVDPNGPNQSTVIDLIANGQKTEDGITYGLWTTGKIQFTPVAGTALRLVGSDAAKRVKEVILFSAGDQSATVLPLDWIQMY